jgi:hypothetical protein
LCGSRISGVPDRERATKKIDVGIGDGQGGHNSVDHVLAALGGIR